MLNETPAFDLIKASLKDVPILENMWPYYVYELTRYCGHLKGWVSPTDLSFNADDLNVFFKDESTKVYLVKIESEFAGFAIITKPEALPDANWYMNDFFISAKYQRHHIGEQVATAVFKQFTGKWAIGVLTDNSPALAFWRKVIKRYTQDNYIEEIKTSEQLKTKDYPDPYPMVMLQFESYGRT